MRSYIHGRKKRLAAAVGAALLSGVFSIVPVAEALPVLDAKDAAVSIATPDAVTMNITSGATNNLIKWVDFSIGKNESVNFNDTNNYLNYVTGSARSDILGTLTGGGSIYIVNPNGILIHDGATVNVGSLYLSTRSLTADQLANYSAATGALFQNDNAAVGDVINLGNLNANVISVEGNNITFKNVADVNNGSAANVTLTANSGGEIHIGSATGGASGYNTNGTTYNYKLISTKEALQNMKDGLAGNYMLAGDIDMSGVSFTPVGYEVVNRQTGQEDDTYAFKGRFDGLGYAVKNLSVNFDYADEHGVNPQYGIGLFGWNKGTVENVKLSGGSIESTQGSIGIIGINNGTVRNVFNDGLTVKGGKDNVGGIVGFNYTGTIKNVWNTGTVSGSFYVGGIAGSNRYGASIENAWNNGSVSGSIHSVGGIVGENNNGIVQKVYNTGAVQSGTSSVGGIVGVNQGSSTDTIVQYAYNTGSVTSSNSNIVGGIVGSNYAIIRNAYSQEGTAAAVSGERGSLATENDVAIKSETDMKQKATFAGFDFSSNGAWRIYEGKTMPLLTAFLTRKDNIKSVTESDGTTAVGATYTATTYNGVQAQNGYNYIKDVSIVTPAPTPTPEPMPMPTPEPTPEPTTELPTALETIVGSREAAKEYTDVVASLDSGANTVLPTTNVLPTESIMPTNSVLPTGNNQPTGSAQPTEKAQENNSASDEQSEAQEQNGLLPAQQTTGGQSAAGSRESHLGITYSDINMPKSMSVEALAAALNGEPTQQSSAPAASNTAPTEPAAMSGTPQGSEPAADGTVEGNEEA